MIHPRRRIRMVRPTIQSEFPAPAQIGPGPISREQIPAWHLMEVYETIRNNNTVAHETNAGT